MMVTSLSNNQNFLYWPDAFSAGEALVGGKGWNLARLARYGFKIPKGGVLVVQAYLDFLTENNLVELINNVANNITIDNLYKKEISEELGLIRKRIKDAAISPIIREELALYLQNLGIINQPVAVRSSATAEDSGEASFAGVHQTVL